MYMIIIPYSFSNVFFYQAWWFLAAVPWLSPLKPLGKLRPPQIPLRPETLCCVESQVVK